MIFQVSCFNIHVCLVAGVKGEKGSWGLPGSKGEKGDQGAQGPPGIPALVLDLTFDLCSLEMQLGPRVRLIGSTAWPEAPPCSLETPSWA